MEECMLQYIELHFGAVAPSNSPGCKFTRLSSLFIYIYA